MQDNLKNNIDQEKKEPNKMPEEENQNGTETSQEESPSAHDEINKLKYEMADLQDKYLRLYSDFENFRRRTNKEKLDIIELASEHIMIELLPVMDDFERALQSMKNAVKIDSVCEGVHLIFAKFKKILEDKGLTEIDCNHKPFDPEYHDAVTKIPAPSKKLKGKVVEQIQKGYLLKNKVIRHSKVIVGD